MPPESAASRSAARSALSARPCSDGGGGLWYRHSGPVAEHSPRPACSRQTNGTGNWHRTVIWTRLQPPPPPPPPPPTVAAAARLPATARPPSLPAAAVNHPPPPLLWYDPSTADRRRKRGRESEQRTVDIANPGQSVVYGAILACTVCSLCVATNGASLSEHPGDEWSVDQMFTGLCRPDPFRYIDLERFGPGKYKHVMADTRQKDTGDAAG